MKLTDQTSKLVELGFIYALLNPKTDEIFYIGATESTPKDRLQGHYNHFKEYLMGKRGKTKKFEYFESIFPEIAKVKLLEIVQNDYLYLKEQQYIKEYSEKYDLVNQTIGGEGGDTFTMQDHVDKLKISELIRNKNLGKKKPEGFAENLSKQRMGANNPAAGTGKTPWFVIFDSKEQPIKLCKAPFEGTAYLDGVYGVENHKKHSGNIGNICKVMNHGMGISKSKGFLFKRFDLCSKEIQDIVLANYESN